MIDPTQSPVHKPHGPEPRRNEPMRPKRQAASFGQVVPFRAGATAHPSFPIFTWEALEQQLSDLAVSSAQRALVKTLVSATRKQAVFKPADLVLREVLCIASVLMDETFHPEAEEGEMS